MSFQQVWTRTLAILATIVAYLGFNAVIAKSPIIDMGLANLVGAGITSIYFRKELFKEVCSCCNHQQLHRPVWAVSLRGSLGIVCIVLGLKFSQLYIGVFATMLLVYDSYVVSNAFIEAFRKWEDFRTKLWVNMVLHILMLAIVTAHISVNWHWDVDVFLHALWFVMLGAFGYYQFNQSIAKSNQIPAQRRATNIAMNLGGGLALLLVSPTLQKAISFASVDMLKVLVGGFTIFCIVFCLGKSYAVFGAFGSLVPVLVYDGLLISPSILQIALEAVPSTVKINVVLTVCMMVIMILRAPHLQSKLKRMPPIGMFMFMF